ncbi:MAG: hypothetical protein AAFR04_11430 [Pseudomonadota bacterium]
MTHRPSTFATSAGEAQAHAAPSASSWQGRLAAFLPDRTLWSKILAPEAITDDPAPSVKDLGAYLADHAPALWMLGKVQAGKSSLAQSLSGDPTIDVGDGFRPCTATAQVYDIPRDAPILRILDTRGLGETAYDPAEDLAWAETRAQVVLVAMRAMDAAQTAVMRVVHEVRARHPGWPIIVAQTALHEGYPRGANHPSVYPYLASSTDEAAFAHRNVVPDGLARALLHQRSLFADIPGGAPIIFVPVDITTSHDALTPHAFGRDTLIDAITKVAPALLAGLATSARQAPAHQTPADKRRAAARPHVIGHAIAAGAADAFPVAGLVAVPSLQAKLLHTLARLHGIPWTRAHIAAFSGALGAGTLGRVLSGFGARQLAKLVPGYGQTIGATTAAAASFATTYALGQTACVYLERVALGDEGTTGLNEVYADALREAFTFAPNAATAPKSNPASDPAG